MMPLACSMTARDSSPACVAGLRAVAAIRYFERNRVACGPPGLLSEEYDVTQRQLRGNLPQAFVHALLLECAATLTGPRADAD
jgi:GH15 family glucan-1,4-alpha-glucosidase